MATADDRVPSAYTFLFRECELEYRKGRLGWPWVETVTTP